MSDKETACFSPTFENGGYWEYYKDLERQFESFLGYVPYLSGNEKIYSFRLANLILSIGAHIDSALKEIVRYSEFSVKYPEMIKPKPSIIDYFPISEIYDLPRRTIIFKRLPKRECILPFREYVRQGNKLKTPFWWQVYNSIKHQFSENFKEANLENTRDSLAGAFLLNIFHVPAYVRLLEFHVITPHFQGESSGNFILSSGWKEKQLAKGLTLNRLGVIETSLFTYDFSELNKTAGNQSSS